MERLRNIRSMMYDSINNCWPITELMKELLKKDKVEPERID